MTILDDHSRFLLSLRACANESHHTVQSQLCSVFEEYGLPEALLMDNGAPWVKGAGYPKGDAVRKVDVSGKVSFHNRHLRVGKPFVGQRVGLRPTPIDDVLDVCFCRHWIKEIDLRLTQEP